MYRLIHSGLLFMAIALSVHLATAQSSIDKGVHFEHGLSWSAIKFKAITEHKYILVDCYATWCGPCKYMSSSIFPQKTAGDFFNSRFVNVKVQMDTTDKDDEDVKKWYADAHLIKTQYNIQAFPSFLIFAPDGSVIDRIVGGELTAKAFIVRVRTSFDPSKQYYTQLLQFKSGKCDSGFLRSLAYQCHAVNDNANGLEVLKAWQNTQKEPYTTTGMDLLQKYTQHMADPGFAVFLQHAPEIDNVMGNGWAGRQVNYLIIRDLVQFQVNQSNNDPDWSNIQQLLTTKYPGQAEEVVALSKVLYYKHVKGWPEFRAAITDYMQKYGAHATSEELNNYAWTVFSNCPDMDCVADALNWSERSCKDKPNPLFMNTYANILYKMGKKEDAIVWEQKAITLSNGDDQYTYRSILDKMKRGEKTWN